MGKKKPKKAKAQYASSPFQSTNSFNVDLGSFGGANAVNNNSSIDVNSFLGPQLQSVFDTSSAGLDSNLGILGRNPTQQLQDINDGRNSFFNLQSANNADYLRKQLDSSLLDSSRRGVFNSTAAGAREGEILSDAVLRDLQTRNDSILAQNQLAQGNASQLLNTLNSLAAIQQFPAQLSQGGLMQALMDRSNTSRLNAQLGTNVNLANAAAENAFAQQPGILGSLAPVAGTALGMFLGGPGGGAIGNRLGSVFNNGSGGGAQPPMLTSQSPFSFSQPSPNIFQSPTPNPLFSLLNSGNQSPFLGSFLGGG